MYWTDLAELRLSDLTHFSISAFQQIFVVGLTPHLWLFHKNKNIQSKVSSWSIVPYIWIILRTFPVLFSNANHFKFCVEHMGSVRMQISASTMWEMAGRVQFLNTLTFSWHIFLAYSGIYSGIFLAYLAYFLGIYYTWSATNLLFGEIVFLFLSYLLLRRVCNIFLHMLQSVFVARNDGFNYRLWFLCSSTVLCSMSKIK